MYCGKMQTVSGSMFNLTDDVVGQLRHCWRRPTSRRRYTTSEFATTLVIQETTERIIQALGIRSAAGLHPHHEQHRHPHPPRPVLSGCSRASVRRYLIQKRPTF